MRQMLYGFGRPNRCSPDAGGAYVIGNQS